MGFLGKNNTRGRCFRCLFGVSIWLLTSTIAGAQHLASYERPPVDYYNAEVSDPVAQLADDVEKGRVLLEFTGTHGYLRSVLERLEIPISSQVLVFSKTSMQISRISATRPRAIYFNDNTYVGWCQYGDVIELAATDSQQGATFYTLKQAKDRPPRFVRDRGDCLSCHASARTQSVPGYLIRSVFPDRRGQPNYGSGSFTTDHTSPFRERWGGWYVTGLHGEMRHMGNTFYAEDDIQGDRESGANRQSLQGLVATHRYLSPHSDLVALMVLEHQTQMHNSLFVANYTAREALHRSYSMNKLLERPHDHISDSARRQIDRVADQVVSRMLMCDEFVLEDPISGTGGFAEEFVLQGKTDSRGRSLRDLDLQLRLFRYPCSYLIHSPEFRNLPPAVREPIIRRIDDVLNGRNKSSAFSHISSAQRRAILEILRDTEPELFP